MTSKIASERMHRRRRMMQRQGRRMSNDSYRRMEQAIRANRAVLLWRTSNTRTAWAVRHDGQWLAVVYNRTTHQIVTVLPDAVIEEHRAKLPEPKGDRHGY